MANEQNGFGEKTVPEREDEVKSYYEESSKPFVTSHELAEAFDTDRAVAYRTLENLLKSGYFQKERIGAGGAVYYQER